VIPLGVVVPYLFGWRLNGGAWSAVSPVVALLYFGYWAFSNVKNLPDMRGDRRIGLRSIFARGKRVVRLLFASPYLLIGGLVAAGLLPAKFLWSMLTVPGAVLLFLLVARSRTPLERNAVYQVGFLYAHAFLTVLLLADHPSAAGFAAGLVLVGGRVLVTAMRLDRRMFPTDPPVARTGRALLRG
jgi:4-hydroxybenzoate polyprenyltransferase